MGFLEAVHPHDKERVDQAVSDALAGNNPDSLEFEIIRPDGDVRSAGCYFEVLRDEAKSPTMGELTASMAHQVNQPLAAILSNAQAASRFLSSASPDLTRVRECLTDIAADDKRAGEVIKSLRELLKKGNFGCRWFDLNEVVGEVIRLVGHHALLENVSIRFEPLPSVRPVLGDRIQLYQMALNLILNGLYTTAERPLGKRWVLVRTVESSGGIELTVEDSGKGIAEGDLPHLFEPFFSTKREGLGMELSISRSIVRAHGGRICAESVVGGCAIFRCTLPVAQQATAVSAK